jgi:hypothetical protein
MIVICQFTEVPHTTGQGANVGLVIGIKYPDTVTEADPKLEPAPTGTFVKVINAPSSAYILTLWQPAYVFDPVNPRAVSGIEKM